jgi:DNA-binding response OmpR family regulator
MPRILVVDDQPDVGSLLKTMLEIHGLDVEVVESGRWAVDLLASGKAAPDLILLDVQMPDLDGWETLERIRSSHGELEPRIVMCTVKGHPSDLLRGWSLGCDGYVWKPFDLKMLVAEIEAVLKRSDGERMRTRRTAIGEARLMLGQTRT